MASNVIEMSVEERTQTGSAAARRLRKKGLIPAVIYVPGQDSVHITLKGKEAFQKLHGQHVLRLKTETGKEWNALVEEIQHGILTNSLDHVAFKAVDMNKEVSAHVPLSIVGDAIGESKGGIVELLLHEIEIVCLPTNLPEQIRVDVSKLDVGEHISLGELPLPEGVKLAANADREQTVVMVAEPHVHEEAEEAEAEGEEGADESSEAASES
ncbi:MAG: 50S ribosomal protein L25 [Lentisphaerae bacterium]|nr:MAG: 50S ribosomal protein L25 [Lentisphaerota bacterium]